MRLNISKSEVKSLVSMRWHGVTVFLSSVIVYSFMLIIINKFAECLLKFLNPRSIVSGLPNLI